MASEVKHKVPVIKLWGQLVVSLQGEISDTTASALLTDVLCAIRDYQATGLVLDVSGVPLIDSHLCVTLAHIGAASKLMGTKAVLCGLSPEISSTLQSMGIELSQLTITKNLEEAMLSLGVVAKQQKQEDHWQLIDELLAHDKT